jgi:hypothetical protein
LRSVRLRIPRLGSSRFTGMRVGRGIMARKESCCSSSTVSRECYLMERSRTELTCVFILQIDWSNPISSGKPSKRCTPPSYPRARSRLYTSGESSLSSARLSTGRLAWTPRLYSLEIEPHRVDVNVHPTKSEVSHPDARYQTKYLGT